MNFVADESVDYPIIRALRAAGHTVQAVVELAPGTTDDAVLRLAEAERAPLLTSDKDFGDLVYRLQRVHHGVILLRLAGLPAAEKGRLLVQVVEQRAHELQQAFVVLTPRSVRIRTSR